MITLVDEYYDESDFHDFCNSISNKNFTTMVAIKKLNFPDEYLKNYAVSEYEDNEVIGYYVGAEIISNFFRDKLI